MKDTCNGKKKLDWPYIIIYTVRMFLWRNDISVISFNPLNQQNICIDATEYFFHSVQRLNCIRTLFITVFTALHSNVEVLRKLFQMSDDQKSRNIRTRVTRKCLESRKQNHSKKSNVIRKRESSMNCSNLIRVHFCCAKYNVVASRYLSSMFLVLNLTIYIFKMHANHQPSFTSVFLASQS